MVRNHAEIKRGKARMVINYKRLNDNTEDDKYNIPDKDQLINRILTAKIFSKFDCKSGFCADNGEQQNDELWGIFSSYSCRQKQIQTINRN